MEKKWPGHRAGWCIHYCASPPHYKKDQSWICGAGVDMRKTWNGVKFDKRPCFLDDEGNSKLDAMPCEHLRRPTSEEIAEHEAWCEARMDNLRVVMIGISDWRKKHKGKSHAEVIECPACKGRLHLSIAAVNGHVHGKCETDGCVSWME